MQHPVRKAVFPVGGLGAEFLPATKASPKEMMPIVDKPLIQYAVEEAVAAGCNQLIFITGRSTRAITDHFDTPHELEHTLRERGKLALLEQVRNIVPRQVSMVFVHQPRSLGLGDAVLCAKDVIGDAPFAVLLASHLLQSKHSALQQMFDQYQRHPFDMMGVHPVSAAKTSCYTLVESEVDDRGLLQVKQLFETPHPAGIPHRLAAVGRYVFSPQVFRHLAQIQPSAEGRYRLSDAIHSLLSEKPVLAQPLQGRFFDCDDKLDYLAAMVEFGLEHDEVRLGLRAYLKGRCVGSKMGAVPQTSSATV